MVKNKKKALVLLKALVFHYHGLDSDEKKTLEEFVTKIKAEAELRWSLDFISNDYLSAFDRSREFLGKVFKSLPEEERLKHLLETWEDNHKKGYVTEMETSAMIKLAKDWSIQKTFVKNINN